MVKQLDFKFKYVDESGNERGFTNKKGSFTGRELILEEIPIPVEAVLKTYRHFNRLILEILQEDGKTIFLNLAITQGGIAELRTALNAVSSARWAKLRRESLEEKGQASRFRTEKCPHCLSIVDLTDTPNTPQAFCYYCETIITRGASITPGEDRFRLCDQCGFYASPREFSTFYFYFLLVLYGWRSQKRCMCHSCMRREGWKMLLANLIFILGVPFAIIQLVRAYAGGTTSDEVFAGLDKANILAKKGRARKALEAYQAILDRNPQAAGIHYNIGLAFTHISQYEPASQHFQKALETCGNYTPAFDALCACFEACGQHDRLRALKKAWGLAEENTSSPATDTPS